MIELLAYFLALVLGFALGQKSGYREAIDKLSDGGDVVRFPGGDDGR